MDHGEAGIFIRAQQRMKKRECICWCHVGTFSSCKCARAGGCGSPGIVRTDTAAFATVYDATGKPIATINPLDRKRTAIKA